MAPYRYDLAYFDQAGRPFQTVRSTGARDKVILDPEGREIPTVRRGQKVKGSHAEHVRQGVVSPRGNGWALSSIRVILMNPVYVGRVVWNRRTMGKFHRIADRREVERDGCGKRRMEWNSPDDWLVFEDAHEPIVERAVFERAQRIMRERRNRTRAAGFLSGRGKVSTYLLSGLLRCGACGRTTCAAPPSPRARRSASRCSSFRSPWTTW